MKPIQEITEALGQKYTRADYTLAPIKTLHDGNDYISWNDSADLLNGLFGPMAWSSSIVSCTYREVDDGEKTHRGYEAVVRVTVGFIDTQGDNATTHRDGAGFAPAVPQGNKNPLDLAFKAAASDAFSRAVKQLGDHFGLFLYDKPADEQHTTTQRPASAPNTGGGGAKTLSAKQLDWLGKKGMPVEITAILTYDQGKAALDNLFAGETAQSVVEGMGLTWTAPARAKDKFPIPSR